MASRDRTRDLARRLFEEAWPPLALVVPLGGSIAVNQAVMEMMVKLVDVVGLSVFIGNSGIMSFGHVAVLCVGAYSAAWQTCCPMLKPIVMAGLPDQRA